MQQNDTHPQRTRTKTPFARTGFKKISPVAHGKTARGRAAPQIGAKAEGSALLCATEAWSVKMGCVAVPQRRSASYE